MHENKLGHKIAITFGLPASNQNRDQISSRVPGVPVNTASKHLQQKELKQNELIRLQLSNKAT